MELSLLTLFIAAICLSLMTAPLGCFVVWKRMAYFGDAISHSGLLGVAIATSLHLPNQIGALLTCISFAFLLIYARKITFLANDTLLGILAHGSLSIGLIYISLTEHLEEGHEEHTDHDSHGHEITEILFGSLDSITTIDLVILAVGALISFAVIKLIWKQAVLASINEELATAEGIKTKRIEWIITALMAFTVAICVHFVGVLLVTALLIIPPATARLLSNSPNSMLVASIIIGVATSLLGIVFAETIHAPVAASIVFVTVIAFVLVSIFFKLKQK